MVIGSNCVHSFTLLPFLFWAVCREVGGQMQPIWHHYYAEAAAVLFVVDVAAPEAIAEAAIQLFDLLKQPQLQVRVATLRFGGGRV